MTSDTTFVPETGVIPSITLTNGVEALEFYKEAFGAKQLGSAMVTDDGLLAHAEIEIEGTRIMLGDEWPDAPNKAPSTLGASTGVLFVYTTDVDALWARAIAAGATEVFPLQVQFYGDKAGRVQDPYGHQWGLGQKVEELSDEEVEQRGKDFLAENG